MLRVGGQQAEAQEKVVVPGAGMRKFTHVAVDHAPFKPKLGLFACFFDAPLAASLGWLAQKYMNIP